MNSSHRAIYLLPQLVCDNNMVFTDVLAGWPGSVHDSRVLRNSELFHTAVNKFPGDTHLLGDGGYPLLRCASVKTTADLPDLLIVAHSTPYLTVFGVHLMLMKLPYTVPGGGVLPYMGYMGMCRCEGYGFQAVYSRTGYINQSVWV